MDAEKLQRLKKLVAPHVQSFDYFITTGLQKVMANLPPVTLEAEGSSVSFWFEDVKVERPCRDDTRSSAGVRELRIFPRECRESGSTYAGALNGRLHWQYEGSDEVISKDLRLSSFPVMARFYYHALITMLPPNVQTVQLRLAYCVANFAYIGSSGTGLSRYCVRSERFVHFYDM